MRLDTLELLVMYISIRQKYSWNILGHTQDKLSIDFYQLQLDMSLQEA